MYNELNFTHTYPLFLKILNDINAGILCGNLLQEFPQLKDWLKKKSLNEKEKEKLTNQINQISKVIYESKYKEVVAYTDEFQVIHKISPKTELEIKKYSNHFFYFITTNTKVILCNYSPYAIMEDIENKFLIACTKYDDNRCHVDFESGCHIMNTYLAFTSYKEIHFPFENKVKYSMNKKFYNDYKASMYNSPILTYCEGILGYSKVNNMYDKNYTFGFIKYNNIISIINYEKINTFDKYYL